MMTKNCMAAWGGTECDFKTTMISHINSAFLSPLYEINPNIAHKTKIMGYFHLLKY